jgi:hypothetical protein
MTGFEEIEDGPEKLIDQVIESMISDNPISTICKNPVKVNEDDIRSWINEIRNHVPEREYEPTIRINYGYRTEPIFPYYGVYS